MEITVANCLALPSLQGARVVAGANGLSRSVRAVSVLETAAASNYLTDTILLGEEMIITGFIATPDDEELQCNIVKILHAAGESALILFYVGVIFMEIPQRMIDIANELDFPMICMPEGRIDIPYSDVICEVMELIFRRKLRANAWHGEPEREAEAEFVQALLDDDRLALRRLHRYAHLSAEKINGFRFIAEPLNHQSSEKQELGKIVLKIVRDHYSQLGIQAYAAVCDGAIVVLLKPHHSSTDKFDQLHNAVEKKSPGVLFAAFDLLTNLESIREAYALCHRTLHSAKAIFPRRHTFTRHDLGFADNCLRILLAGEDALRPYQSLIEPLCAGDSGNADLIGTLSTLLLDAGNNTAEAAKMLFLHKNTVQYRIRKMRELLGEDIFSLPVQFELATALALQRLGPNDSTDS